MFPEMRLTVNEVEKLPVEKKIKFCQSLVIELRG